MKMVLLHTCGAEGSFALADTSLVEPVHVMTMPGRSASEMLVRLLRQAMTGAGWTMRDVEAIAVVTGPGSFTGVRVGLSAAKGLSESVNIPLIAVSRLELLATMVLPEGVLRDGERTVCALLDAGRGEFYCGRYAGEVLLGESLTTLEEVLALCEKVDEVVVCEDVVEQALVGRRLVTSRVTEPTAGDALPIAWKRFQRSEFSDAATLDANYLRRTDAEIFVSSPRKATG